MKEVIASLMQQKYVVEGAWATCIFGVAPARFSTIMDNKFVSFNVASLATTMSLGPCFPPPGFGMCNMVPNMPKPCTCQIVKWDLADNCLKINRIAQPLTTMSRGQCALGTPMCVSFTMPGQLPIPGTPGFAVQCAIFDSEMNPLANNTYEFNCPQITNIKTLDSNWNPIDTVPKDGYVTFVADTINHEIGDQVTFDVDGIGKFYGYVEKDNKAYARYCYLGSAWDELKKESTTDSNTKKGKSKRSSKGSNSKNKDKIADSLKNDPNALSNIDLKLLGRDSWDKPNEGFEYDLTHNKLDLKGMTQEEFIKRYKLSSLGVAGMKDPNTDKECRSIDGLSAYSYGTPLTQAQQKQLLDIRKNQYDKENLNENTVFQKVVCCDRNLREWLTTANGYGSKGSLAIVGSTILAKDGKHLKTPADLYDGLQLNYGTPSGNPYYPPPPKCMYVVRYTTRTPENAKIPVHDLEEVPDNPEGYRDRFTEVKGNKYPFRGGGYTPACGKDKKGNERVGTPELYVQSDNAQQIEKAIIVRIDEDGTETIVGYKTMKEVNGKLVPQFVCVDENGNEVKEFSSEESNTNWINKKKLEQKEMDDLTNAANI